MSVRPCGPAQDHPRGSATPPAVRPGTPTSPRAAAVAATLLVSALALTACGAQPHPAPSATALPSGIVATLLPATPAQTADEARVWITNETESELTLTRLRIDAPVFAGIGRATTAGSIEVDAGRSAEIVVTLPAIDCTVDDAGAPATTTETAGPDADPTADPAGSADDPTATVGFALGAAVGVAVETLEDPQGVVAARAAAACD